MTTAPSAKFVKWSIYLLSAAQITLAIPFYLYSLLGSQSDIFITNNAQIIVQIYYSIVIVSFIVSARWIYKEAQYNSNLGATDLKYTPGWTVGWFFVPVFWLWKPYQAFKQLYQVSANCRDWQSVKVPNIFPIWWSLWLLLLFSIAVLLSIVITLPLLLLSFFPFFVLSGPLTGNWSYDGIWGEDFTAVIVVIAAIIMSFFMPVLALRAIIAIPAELHIFANGIILPINLALNYTFLKVVQEIAKNQEVKRLWKR